MEVREQLGSSCSLSAFMWLVGTDLRLSGFHGECQPSKFLYCRLPQWHKWGKNINRFGCKQLTVFSREVLPSDILTRALDSHCPLLPCFWGLIISMEQRRASQGHTHTRQINKNWSTGYNFCMPSFFLNSFQLSNSHIFQKNCRFNF